MTANFFSKTKPIHAIFVAVLFLVYFLLSIFIIEQPDLTISIFFEKIGLLFFFLILFFLTNFINRKNYLTESNSYVLLFLTLLFGMFPHALQLSNVLYAYFFLLLAFRRIYSIRTLKSVKQKLLDSGIWISVASLIFSWSAIFLVLVFVAVLVYRKRDIRSYIIPIVGFIIPLFLMFTYCYVFKDVSMFTDKLIFAYNFDYAPYLETNILLPLSVLTFYTIIGLILVNLKVFSFATELKQSWFLILIHFFCALYFTVFSPTKNGAEFLFAFFPLAIIFGNTLQLIKHKIFSEVYVYGLLIVSFIVYFL